LRARHRRNIIELNRPEFRREIRNKRRALSFVNDSFNPYTEWFGIAGSGGRPNHYALLGIAPFEPDVLAIVAAFERRTAVLAGIEPGVHEPLRQKLAAELTRARQTLTDAVQKKQYDELLRRKATPRSAVQTRAAAGCRTAGDTDPRSIGERRALAAARNSCRTTAARRA
jgi:hypothetical protein